MSSSLDRSVPVYLSAEDVRKALPMRDAIEAMRDAFSQLSRGEANLPKRVRLDAPSEQGCALVMPCHSTRLNLFSVKMATVFERNPELGLPLIQSSVLLTDGATGAPLAVMDGASLTAIRTGAASGLATELLAREESATVAVIGSGVQARSQLEAVCCVRPIRCARVFDLNIESAERFAHEMGGALGIEIACCAFPFDAIIGADVVCTATPSKLPVFEDGCVALGTHINAVGSFRPDMIEIPAETVCQATVFVDHLESSLEEAGDLVAPLKAGRIDALKFVELGDVALGLAPGRSRADEITLFKSVGVAIQDLCAAARVFRNVAT